MKKITKQEVRDVIDSCFIAKYNKLFGDFLQRLSPITREQIRKNKELDELFDLFLDYILDSSQHLDYKQAKELESEVDKETVA